MAAIINLYQKILKWFLIISVGIILCLLIYQTNLPSTPFQTLETNQHNHAAHKGSTVSSENLVAPAPSESPRDILGTPVRYVFNNLVCDSNDNGDTVFMLILITSHVGDMNIRRKHREILPQSQLDGMKVKRLFLLATPPPPLSLGVPKKDSKYADVEMKEVDNENIMFKDILMGDFTESYKNLTFKHLMGLEWAATYCSKAKFVLKQDDDTIVDYYQLLQLLNTTDLGHQLSNPDHPFIYGKVLSEQKVVREEGSKWFVPLNEYRYEMYPPFVSGWAYITTIPAIQMLVRASETEEYFFIDDAFITGILRMKTPIGLIDMKDYFTIFKGQLLCCVSVPMFAKSANNEPYWCDYMVGPSNDDLNLMEIYQRHSQYCHMSKSCKRREVNALLERKCVITDNMEVQDFKQLETPSANKGVWKPLAVIRHQ